MAAPTEPDAEPDGEGRADSDAILIRWSAEGHWVYSIEDMDPLSAIAVLHIVINALCAEAETALPWDGADEMES